MGRITINGKTYYGNNIIMTNGKIIIDGKPIEDGLSGVVELKVEGDLVSLHSDCSVTVNGDVKGNVSAGTSVNCKNVDGNVQAGSSVNCGNVGGNVKAGNSVTCRNVNGDVKAGNSIFGLRR